MPTERVYTRAKRGREAGRNRADDSECELNAQSCVDIATMAFSKVYVCTPSTPFSDPTCFHLSHTESRTHVASTIRGPITPTGPGRALNPIGGGFTHRIATIAPRTDEQRGVRQGRYACTLFHNKNHPTSGALRHTEHA